VAVAVVVVVVVTVAAAVYSSIVSTVVVAAAASTLMVVVVVVVAAAAVDSRDGRAPFTLAVSVKVKIPDDRLSGPRARVVTVIAIVRTWYNTS
jgi:hypothetical protein